MTDSPEFKLKMRRKETELKRKETEIASLKDHVADLEQQLEEWQEVRCGSRWSGAHSTVWVHPLPFLPLLPPPPHYRLLVELAPTQQRRSQTPSLSASSRSTASSCASSSEQMALEMSHPPASALPLTPPFPLSPLSRMDLESNNTKLRQAQEAAEENAGQKHLIETLSSELESHRTEVEGLQRQLKKCVLLPTCYHSPLAAAPLSQSLVIAL